MKDPGLQPERTALAWSRTVMALFVDAGLVVRSGWAHQRFDVIAIGAAVMATCALVVILSHTRGQEILRVARQPRAIAVAMPFTIAMAAFLVSASAILLCFV